MSCLKKLEMNEVVYRNVLSKAEMQALYDLQAVGMQKGLAYKIDLGMQGGIILKQGDLIKGFMTVDCFGGDEIESAAITYDMVHWDMMAEALIAYAKEKEAKQLLFICDRNDQLICKKLKSIGLEPSFSEYRMELDVASYVAATVTEVSLRRAEKTDSDYINGLDQDAFGAAGPMSADDMQNTYIVMRNEKAVGKLRIDENDGNYGIYGLIIEDAMRGQGIGGQAMSLILSELISLDATRIYLEVDSGNPSAFHLYKKLGFKIMSEFLYYPYNLQDTENKIRIDT